MFQFEGITLHKLDRHFLPELFLLKQESWFGTHTVSIVNMQDQERWFDSLDNNPTHPINLVLTATSSSDEIFGIYKIFHINWVNRTAEVGWDVFAKFRNKGFGYKLVNAGTAFCFEMLNLRRLTAEIITDNVASKKCALSTGFKSEGIKLEVIERRGQFKDVFIFGYLSKDWFNER